MDPDYNDEDDDDFDMEESDDEDIDTMDVEQRKRGRPKKNFSESSYDVQKRRTDEIMDYLRESAKELGISLNYLVNFIGRREANINGDDDLAKLFKELNRTGKADPDKPKLSELKALSLKKRLLLSRNKYHDLVQMLGHSNVLPSKDAVKKYEDKIKIKLEPFLGGYKADLKDAITKTVLRILKMKNYSDKNCKQLIVKLTAGFDGSGSHIQRSSKHAKVNTKVGRYHTLNL